MIRDYKKIYLSSPHMCGEELKFVEEAFNSNWIAPLGPHVDAFESEIAGLSGVKAAAALSSGTAAIHMALKYCGVTRGDTVFCSALTFAASCNPIKYEGAEPVFIDSEPGTWCMSPVALEKAFMHCAKQGRVPKAVIVVNLYGQSADYDPILDICSKHHVPVIEDAAESLGATYKGRLSGSIGYFGVYSFNGNKIITTSGGGMLVSDDEDAIKKVRFWVTQARDNARHYQHSELGYNYRMSNILAAIGRGQLRALKQRIEQKKHIYETYKENLSCIEDIEFMPIAAYGEPNFWLSVMTLSENSKVRPIDIMMELEKHNIESRPVWKPMQLQPYYSDCEFFSHTDEGASISEDIFERGVCLPSDTKLCDSDIVFIVSIIERKLLQN
jgi:pyridoxal phosphate-dependent aminotransferase EpsN